MATRRREDEQRTWVRHYTWGPGFGGRSEDWAAVCGPKCAWTGPLRGSRQEAANDAVEHAGERDAHYTPTWVERAANA